MAYSASFTLDLGTTGLTLKAALTAAGTIHATFRDVTTTFYADAAGGYEFVTAAIPDSYRGMIVFYTGTLGAGTDFSGVTTYSRGSINPQELENTDVKTSTVSGGGGSGSGAYTVTVTVTASAVPLQSANVRLVEGASAYVATTNASGVATFALDAATYSIAITKAGYTHTPSTIVVTAAANFAQSMTATTTPSAPADPTLCRVYGYVINAANNRPMIGVQVHATRVPEGAAYAGGFLVGNRKSTATDGDGLFQLDLVQTDEIEMQDGSTPQWKISIPAAGVETLQSLTTTTLNLGTTLFP